MAARRNNRGSTGPEGGLLVPLVASGNRRGSMNAAAAQAEALAAAEAFRSMETPRRSSDDSNSASGEGGENGGENILGVANEQAHEFTAGASSSITVLVRVRPLSVRELSEQTRSIVTVLSSRLVVVQPPSVGSTDYLRQGRVADKRFAFDSAWGPQADQDTLFRHSTKNLIGGVVAGFNATCFAYGATGAGKTHTMSGTPSSPGIMVLTLMSLFRRIEEIQAEKTYTYRVSLSLLEIYNENLRDLLATKGTATAVAASASGSSAAASGGGAAAAATGSSSGSSSLAASGEHFSEQLHNSGGVLHGHVNPNSLELREDPLKGMVVAGITEVRGINSSARILALLEQGNARRTTEPTRANEVSSRSHQVLQIHIERHEVTQGLVQAVKVGKLNLIDLAGSERAARTENKGVRLREAADINKSLLALANVINALASGPHGSPPPDSGGGGDSHVNYRDSKLTRLLKDSLSGNCKTVMICCCSPAENSYEETLNTLKYADRAKAIKTRVDSNDKTVAMQVSQYEKLVSSLRQEIVTLKQELYDAHHGQGGLVSPITSAPQYRHSRIPSVQRSPSSASPLRPRPLRVQLPGSLDGSPLTALPELAAGGGGQGHTKKLSHGSPSRLLPPASSSYSELQSQQARLQELLDSTSPQGRRNAAKAARSRSRGDRQQLQHQQLHGYQQQLALSGGWGSAAAASSNHQLRAAHLSRRDKMQLFLALPEQDQSDLASAFSYLRAPMTGRSGAASAASSADGASNMGAGAGAGMVVLPPSLDNSLANWPFDLLRQLLSKLWGEVLVHVERLGAEVLRPTLALRARLRKKRARAQLIEAQARAVAAREAAQRAAMKGEGDGDGDGQHVQWDDDGNPITADDATEELDASALIPSALRTELDSLSERLGRLHVAEVKLREKTAFKSALAERVLANLFDRIAAYRANKGAAANDRMPAIVQRNNIGDGDDDSGGSGGPKLIPSNARMMLLLEHKSFTASLSKLLAMEASLRAGVALAVSRERIDKLEDVVRAQDAFLADHVRPQIERDFASPPQEKERKSRAVDQLAQRAEEALRRPHFAPASNEETGGGLTTDRQLLNPLLASPLAVRAAMRLQALPAQAAPFSTASRHRPLDPNNAAASGQPTKRGQSNAAAAARSRSRRRQGAAADGTVSRGPLSPLTSPLSAGAIDIDWNSPMPAPGGTQGAVGGSGGTRLPELSGATAAKRRVGGGQVGQLGSYARLQQQQQTASASASRNTSPVRRSQPPRASGIKAPGSNTRPGQPLPPLQYPAAPATAAIVPSHRPTVVAAANAPVRVDSNEDFPGSAHDGRASAEDTYEGGDDDFAQEDEMTAPPAATFVEAQRQSPEPLLAPAHFDADAIEAEAAAAEEEIRRHLAATKLQALQRGRVVRKSIPAKQQSKQQQHQQQQAQSEQQKQHPVQQLHLRHLQSHTPLTEQDAEDWEAINAMYLRWQRAAELRAWVQQMILAEEAERASKIAAVPRGNSSKDLSSKHLPQGTTQDDASERRALEEQHRAAIRIQSVQRGRVARKHTAQLKQQKQVLAAGAVAVVSSGGDDEEYADDTEAEEAYVGSDAQAELDAIEAQAALMIQAAYRGHAARKSGVLQTKKAQRQQQQQQQFVDADNAAEVPATDHTEAVDSLAEDLLAEADEAERLVQEQQQHRAASKIQAVQRGRAVRKRLPLSSSNRRQGRSGAGGMNVNISMTESALQEAVQAEQQHRAAVKIQALQRGRAVRQQMAEAMRMAEEEIRAEHERQQEEQQQQQQAHDEAAAEEAEFNEQHHRAATKIQAVQRGRLVRKQQQQLRPAQLIPSSGDGNQDWQQQLPEASSTTVDDDADAGATEFTEDHHRAATKIQAVQRGRLVRKQQRNPGATAAGAGGLQEQEQSLQQPPEASSLAANEDDADAGASFTEDHHRAATKIQAVQRGRAARRDIKAQNRQA